VNRRGSGLALRLAEVLICGACRALPEYERGEREMEWMAEAEAIARHADGPWIARDGAMLRFAISLLVHRSSARRASSVSDGRGRPLKGGTRRALFRSSVGVGLCAAIDGVTSVLHGGTLGIVVGAIGIFNGLGIPLLAKVVFGTPSDSRTAGRFAHIRVRPAAPLAGMEGCGSDAGEAVRDASG
jgi:hypothetical protein